MAQAGSLTGTGSRYYHPDSLLEGVLFVRFSGNRITGFDGRDARRAEEHYRRVGCRFGMDAGHVHSWHAGIHPGCAWTTAAGQDPGRWSGGAFGNPRILHFHSCGAYAPGEISLNIIDPTVSLDGIALWESGRLRPERIPGGADLLARRPDLADLLAAPETAIGLGPDGRLGTAENTAA